MRTASFLGFFTFGRRSGGRRGPPHAQNFCSISMGKSVYPIILCGVSIETTPLTRTNAVVLKVFVSIPVGSIPNGTTLTDRKAN